jgi:hypothetical protein
MYRCVDAAFIMPTRTIMPPAVLSGDAGYDAANVAATPGPVPLRSRPETSAPAGPPASGMPYSAVSLPHPIATAPRVLPVKWPGRPSAGSSHSAPFLSDLSGLRRDFRWWIRAWWWIGCTGMHRINREARNHHDNRRILYVSGADVVFASIVVMRRFVLPGLAFVALGSGRGSLGLMAG